MHNETTDQLINPSPCEAPAFQYAHPALQFVGVQPSSLDSCFSKGQGKTFWQTVSQSITIREFLNLFSSPSGLCPYDNVSAVPLDRTHTFSWLTISFLYISPFLWHLTNLWFIKESWLGVLFYIGIWMIDLDYSNMLYQDCSFCWRWQKS